MGKKVISLRGSGYPLKLRGYALLFIIFCIAFPFNVFADETSIDVKDVSSYRVSTYAISTIDSVAEMVAILGQECSNYYTSLKSQINELRQKMNDNFANIYRNADGQHPASLEAIYSYVTSNYEKIITLHNSTMNTFSKVYSNGDYSLYNVYGRVAAEGNRVTKNLTSLKEQLIAKIDSSNSVLQASVQEGSSNIQDNANKNSQNEIDNANNIAEEQKKNDNENTSKIGGFFDKFFENISNFLKSLFMPSDDYFDNLRSDLDIYLTEHLGVVYEFPATLLEETKTMYNGIKSQNINSVALYLRVPEISFTLNGTKHKILSSQSYNLFSFVNEMPTDFYSVFTRTLKIMRALIDISLAIVCFKMIYKQIINKVGIEGGSDL